MAPPLPSWTIIWPCQESSKMTQRGLECEKGDPRSSWSQEREKERERKKEGDRECRRSPSNLSPPFRSGNPDAPSRGFLGLSPLERISARQCWTLRSRRKHERKAHGASKGALAPRRNFFVNSILLSLFFCLVYIFKCAPSPTATTTNYNSSPVLDDPHAPPLCPAVPLERDATGDQREEGVVPALFRVLRVFF